MFPDFIAAHVLGRHIQPKVDGIQPSSTLQPAVLTSQPFDRPPDPNSALSPSVGPVQASGPFGHTFLMNQAYGEPAAMDPAYAPPVLWKQACGPVMVTTRAVIVEQSSLPPGQTLLVHPELLTPVGLDPGCPPMAQPAMVNQSFAPLRPLNDLCPLEVTTSLPPTSAAAPGCVSDYMPIATVPWADQLLTEILYDSAPEPTFSSSLSGPLQWDFVCENGPVYPLQPYLLEGLPPPQSTHQIPAQNAPDPGSGNHFFGEASAAKLYGQHYTGATVSNLVPACKNVISG